MALKIFLEIVTVLSVGWVAGAEIGSWFGIQPIVNRLPYDQQVNLEQRMLKSFGRVMPIVIPFSAVTVIGLVFFSLNEPGVIIWLRSIAAFCIAVTIATTLTINVPINNRTASWRLDEDFKEWVNLRTRWHRFQGVRGTLFLIAFILLTVALAIQ